MTERVFIAVIATAGTALAVASYVSSLVAVCVMAVLAGVMAWVAMWLVERSGGATVVRLVHETAPGSGEEPRAGECRCQGDGGTAAA